jgi:agmatinase
MSSSESFAETKRREFLGVAAAATALGDLEATPASGQEPKAGADSKVSAAQLYSRHAPNRRRRDHPLPDLSQYAGMQLQKAQVALPSAFHDKEVRRIKELGLDPVDSIEDKTEISCLQRAACPTGRASAPS